MYISNINWYPYKEICTLRAYTKYLHCLCRSVNVFTFAVLILLFTFFLLIWNARCVLKMFSKRCIVISIYVTHILSLKSLVTEECRKSYYALSCLSQYYFSISDQGTLTPSCSFWSICGWRYTGITETWEENELHCTWQESCELFRTLQSLDSHLCA